MTMVGSILQKAAVMFFAAALLVLALGWLPGKSSEAMFRRLKGTSEVKLQGTCARNTDCTVNPWCADTSYDKWCSINGQAGFCPSPQCTQGSVITTVPATTKIATTSLTNGGKLPTTTALSTSTKAIISTTAVAPAATSTMAAKAAGLPSPRRVLYIDYRDINWNSPTTTIQSAVDAGYNVILIAFLLSTAPADMAQVWQSAGSVAQLAAINYAHSKGAVIMVSAGGATDSPWTTFADGTSYGNYVGKWAQSNNLDGVDFDIENLAPGFAAGNMNGDQFSQWLADASRTAKQYVKFISHAPQGPYFGPVGNPSYWPGTSGGYSSVEAKSGGAVDFYNVQFYNQGATCYTTFAGLFTKSAADCTTFPGTSVEEIASYGVPLSKITVTKYLLTGDGGNGYVSPSTLNSYLTQAVSLGYKGGVSCWAYAQASSAQWIASVCAGGVC